MAGKSTDSKVRCSFCNKTQNQVRKLIAGPAGVFICDECVEVCESIIEEEFEQEDYSKMLADLGIEGDYEGIGHLAIGYVDGDAPAPSPRRDGRVYWCE